MLVVKKCYAVDDLIQGESISIPVTLVELVASKVGVAALGLWVLLSSQRKPETMANICQQYSISQASFDSVMAKLQALQLAWQQLDHQRNQQWMVSNLPKPLMSMAEQLAVDLEHALQSGDPFNYQSSQSVAPTLQVVEMSQEPAAKTGSNWTDLKLDDACSGIAFTKLPHDMIKHYWDCFVSSNDVKGTQVPERSLLIKQWRSYVNNISTNLAISNKRYINTVDNNTKAKQSREQLNQQGWQALLEQPIPQEQAFIAAINNLASVEQDVWLGFVQQNMRFKNDVMNKTNLKYAFEEYCKTSGQKFKQRQSAARNEFDQQLNDTSWANNLDDVL